MKTIEQSLKNIDRANAYFASELEKQLQKDLMKKKQIEEEQAKKIAQEAESNAQKFAQRPRNATYISHDPEDCDAFARYNCW